MRTRMVLIATLLAACGTPCDPADTDCDGTVDGTEGADCTDCDVVCVEAPGGGAPTWVCQRDGITMPSADFHGFRCSSSEDIAEHAGISPYCGAIAGEPATCRRETGAALATDLAAPRCIIDP